MLVPESKLNFTPIPMHIPAGQWIADFERCDDIAQLRNVMDEINRCQYQLISVTQDSRDIYTVFFRRIVVA